MVQLSSGNQKIDAKCFYEHRSAKKDFERLSLLRLFSLIYPVASTYNFPPTRARLAKKLKITKKVLRVIGVKNIVIVMNSISVLKIKRESQKTRIALGDFYTNDCN